MIKKSYGISFCRKVISIIEEEENKLFDETGFGFHMLSEQIIELKNIMVNTNNGSLPR